MDERLKSIVENMDAMRIGLDESFKFHCRVCGSCCINREDILLSPKDICSMSKELGITTDDFFKKYCEVYIGNASRVPIVRLKPKGTDRRCPLLKKMKCRVHRAKPTICAMYPIGRCLVADDFQEGLKNVDESQIQYIYTNPQCGDDSEIHTVREWLESFGVPVQDEFFLKWQQTVLEMGNIFRKIEKSVSISIMEQVWTAAFVGLYLSYDLSKEFLPQFEENTRKFFSLLQEAFVDGVDKP